MAKKIAVIEARTKEELQNALETTVTQLEQEGHKAHIYLNASEQFYAAVVECKESLLAPEYLQQVHHHTAHSDAGQFNIYSAISFIEKDYITRALQHTQGNVTEAAALLGWDRKSLYRKMIKHGFNSREIKKHLNNGTSEENNG